MPGIEPDDEGGGPPPDPLDRPWIHPSELAAGPRRPSGRAPRRPRSWRRDGLIALGAGTVGALLAVSVLGLVGAFDADPAPARGAVGTPPATDAAAIAAQVSPAIAAVVVNGRDGAERRGSGIAVGDHEILTTADVVPDDPGVVDVEIATAAGTRVPARVGGRDPVTGLVLLRCRGHRMQPADWTDADGVRAGDWVVAVGKPTGRDRWVTSGVVTGVGRWMTDARGQDQAGMITTSTELAAEARGGALADRRGRVVGILAGSATDPVRTGVLPSDMVQAVVSQLESTGTASHGALGVRAEDGRDGVVVTEVVAGSAAAQAGLAVGDRLVALDDVRTPDAATLVYELRRRPAGTRVTMTLHRDGRTVKRAVVLDDASSAPTGGMAPIAVATPAPAGG